MVCFISYFINLNKQLKRKPYTMPKTNEFLWKLKGFQYSTSLDLNIGYYHILLINNESNLCKIFIPGGKYCYKHLIMVVANSLYIFQQKINDLFRVFEFICADIDEILVFKKLE